MKRIIAQVSLILAVVAFSSITFAAESVHIKMRCAGQADRTVRCPNGACSVDGVKPGDCIITLVDDNGKPVTSKYKVTMTWNVATSREAGSGMATGRRSATVTTTTTGSVTSPRDAASGMATGKRMHKPFVITKEWSSTSPQLKVSSPAGADYSDAETWTVSFTYQKIEMK